MIFDQCNGYPILKIDPQPEYIGYGWWRYDDNVYTVESLQSYLFHDVYGNYRANSTAMPGELTVEHVEDVGWCWCGQREDVANASITS